MLKTLAKQGLRVLDDIALAVAPRAPSRRGALVTVLFHSLYRDRAQLSDSALAPNEGVTVEHFRAFVGAMLERGYAAVSPAQVDAGLAPGGNYLMISFDDGYFNNALALPVLEQFAVPATFFISSNHVLQGKAFWWDVFGRELAQMGVSQRAQKGEIAKLKSLTHDEIEAFLPMRFGRAALRPHSDLDRPFAPGELRDFARSPWVHLGNHTCDHAILTNYGAQDMARQVLGCQEALRELAGYAPVAIAYPNGNYSKAVVDVSLAAGLRVGLTVLPRRDALPIAAAGRMTLGRFPFEGGEDARAQCRKFGTAFVPSNVLKTLINSPQRGARPTAG